MFQKMCANGYLLEIACLGTVEDIPRILTDKSVDEVIFVFRKTGQA